ncbi:MAG: type II toxin-antitoxin system RelE/ParE family toxin, partial [Nitrospiria bacterium]
MSEKYEVIWSDIAENDLKNIIQYVAVDDPSNAFKILKKIKEKTSSLYHSPKRCRIVPELHDHGILQYRELIIPPWRILFRVSKKIVYVLSVLDSRQ